MTSVGEADTRDRTCTRGIIAFGRGISCYLQRGPDYSAWVARVGAVRARTAREQRDSATDLPHHGLVAPGNLCQRAADPRAAVR